MCIGLICFLGGCVLGLPFEGMHIGGGVEGFCCALVVVVVVADDDDDDDDDDIVLCLVFPILPLLMLSQVLLL